MPPHVHVVDEWEASFGAHWLLSAKDPRHWNGYRNLSKSTIYTTRHF